MFLWSPSPKPLHTVAAMRCHLGWCALLWSVIKPTMPACLYTAVIGYLNKSQNHYSSKCSRSIIITLFIWFWKKRHANPLNDIVIFYSERSNGFPPTDVACFDLCQVNIMWMCQKSYVWKIQGLWTWLCACMDVVLSARTFASHFQVNDFPYTNHTKMTFVTIDVTPVYVHWHVDANI